MDEKTSTRDRILNAATERIRHYGFTKTTMAEIAADTNMSPGNIYRFFEAKIDIAEAMARRHYETENARLAAIARDKSMPPDKRLHQIFLARLRDSQQKSMELSKLVELAEVLNKERPLFAAELQALERVSLTALIEEGMESGLFAPCDPAFAAEMLQVAMTKFTLPQLFIRSTLPKLEQEMEGVFRLLFHGLYARRPENSNS